MITGLTVEVPAARIRSHRNTRIDIERAERVVRTQLPWLSELDNGEREQCLSEVSSALVHGGDVEAAISVWADVVRQRRTPAN